MAIAGSSSTASLEAVRMAVGPSAADHADGGGLGGLKAQNQSHQEGGEDAQLSGGAQQQGHGVGQQRTKVRHSADAHKDNGRIDGVLHALIEHPHEAHGAAVGGRVIDRLGKQPGEGQVGQQHTKSDGDQQQGLEALSDAQIQQQAGNQNHQDLTPVAGEGGKAGTSENCL